VAEGVNEFPIRRVCSAAIVIHAALFTWRIAMRQTLRATLDATGLPSAEAPVTCMWELVEYLSFQRVAVTYHYQAHHFTVTLPHMDLASVQRLLDEWLRAGPSESWAPRRGSWRESTPSRVYESPLSVLPIGGPAPPERS
jgi:hypothetical protein